MDTLATAIAARLRDSHVIPAVLPRKVGDWLRGSLAHGQMAWTHMIPLTGPEGIQVQYLLSPNGSIHVELRDTYGDRFWQGTLTSE